MKESGVPRVLSLLRRGDLPAAAGALAPRRAGASDLYFLSPPGAGPCAPAASGAAPRLARARILLARRGAALERALPAGSCGGLGAAFLSVCELVRGESARALERLAGPPPSGPAAFWVPFLRGHLLYRQPGPSGPPRLREALAALDAALAAEPRACALSLRALVRFDLGDFEGCAGDARLALELDPRDAQAGLVLMEALATLQRPAEALAQARRAARAHPRSALVLARAGRIHGILGEHAAALDRLREAIRREPRCAAFRAWRGEVLRRSGEPARALRDLEAALRLDPAYFLAYTWRGRLRHNAGDYRLALEDYDRALGLNPGDRRTRAWRAGTYWMAGDVRRCALEFESLHPLEPSSSWNRGARGDEIARRAPQLWRAGGDPVWRDLDRGVAERPQDAWSWAFRGRCLLQGEGREREALRDLTRALQLDRGLAYAYRWRAEALRRLGSRPKALDDLERAWALAPGDPVTLDLKARCEAPA